MKKETITQRQAVSMIAMSIIGSSLVMGFSRNSRQDAWMAALIALAATLPMVYIYNRLLSRFPGKNVFDICIDVFGKVLGRLFIAIFAWYAFHLGSLVLRNFSEFIQATAFPNMPQTLGLFSIILLIIWGVRRGPEVLGRWSSIALPVLLVIVALTVLLLIKDMHLEYLLPVGEHLADVPRDAFAIFSFPFAESVLFLAVLNTVRQGDSAGKAWVMGTVIAGLALLFGMFFRNTLTLGYPMNSDSMFPSYEATSIITAGGFVSRIEAIVGANLLLAGFVKISVCLLAASKGVARLFNADDYRPFVAPLGLMMVALTSIVYKNAMEMFDFLPVAPFYSFPFKVIIPVALAIVAEIKMLLKAKKGGSPSPPPLETDR